MHTQKKAAGWHRPPLDGAQRQWRQDIDFDIYFISWLVRVSCCSEIGGIDGFFFRLVSLIPSLLFFSFLSNFFFGLNWCNEWMSERVNEWNEVKEAMKDVVVRQKTMQSEKSAIGAVDVSIELST